MKPFVMYPKELMACEGITNITTGEYFELNTFDKNLYVWMYSEYLQFKEQGCELYHNIDIMASRNAVSTKSVERSIKKLCDIGVVIKTKVKIDKTGFKSNKYVVLDIFDKQFKLKLTLLDSDTGMRKLLEIESVPVSSSKTIHKANKSSQCVTDYIEESANENWLPF